MTGSINEGFAAENVYVKSEAAALRAWVFDMYVRFIISSIAVSVSIYREIMELRTSCARRR